MKNISIYTLSILMTIFGFYSCVHADSHYDNDIVPIKVEPNKEYVAYVKDAKHVLVDTRRLVCQTEKQFRETMNALTVNKESLPQHLRSGVCKITKQEYLVYLDGVSNDGRVAEIRYTKYVNTGLSTRYTERKWIVTRDRYNEIVEKRKTVKY